MSPASYVLAVVATTVGCASAHSVPMGVDSDTSTPNQVKVCKDDPVRAFRE